MTVDADAFFFAEINDRIGGGATPVGLSVRVFHRVPELGGIAELGCKAGIALLRLQRLPVKRHRGRVKQRAIKCFVLFVPFIRAELVKVEDVGAENKFMADLLHFDFGPGFQPFDLPVGIRFAVFFNIFIDLLLDFLVPTFPVARLHCFLQFCIKCHDLISLY